MKFVWGRSRLPYDIEGIRDRHCIDFEDYKGDSDFPVAHTWYKSFTKSYSFFSIDFPKYSSLEMTKTRLLTAISLCGEIDADRDYVDDVDDD